MSFLVLCPRCRHQVSVQESMAGQPARCPYCKSPFQVPSPPRSATPPAPRPSAAPPRSSVSPERPAHVQSTPRRPQLQPAPKKTRTKPRKTQGIPSSDVRVLFERPARSPRTLFLGLMSAGIVVILVAGAIGTAIYFSRDQIHPSQGKAARDSSLAKVQPPKTSTTTSKRRKEEEEPRPKIKLDQPLVRDDVAVEEPPPVDPIAAKPQEKTAPSVRVQKEEPKPTRPEKTKSDAIAQNDPPEPAPPAEVEPPKPAPVPKAEPSKRKSTPRAVAQLPEPDVKEEKAGDNAPPGAEAPKIEEKSSPIPARRRLSDDELYRRLVKSCVFVRTPEGWGSGSLIHKSRKLILTNFHVVEDTKEVHVSFPRYDSAGELIVDGKFYEGLYQKKQLIRGKVFRVAKEQDLALVELESIPERTPALKLAPRKASPGQAVHTVSNTGVSDARWQYIPGKVRQLHPDKTWRSRGGDKVHTFHADILETNSATNPGDSGGPLVNDGLQLVGVTQGANVAARGVSYFIEGNEVKKLLRSCDIDLNEVTGSSSDAEGGVVEASDVVTLIKCLEHTDAKVRIEAAERLAELGPQAKRAAAALVKALKDKEPLVRQKAAIALGKLGPDAGKDVRKDVVNALRDKDAEVRLAALEALANLGKPDLRELPNLLDMLHSWVEEGQFKSCSLIARVLALLGSSAKSAVPDLREMLKSENASVRSAALLTLWKIGPEAREAAPEMSKVLKDADRDVSILAAIALTAIDPSLVGAGREAVSVLVLALRPASKAETSNDQASALRQEIAAALVKIGEPVVERLLKAIKSDFRRGRNKKGTEAADLDAMARAAVLKIIAGLGRAAHSTETMRILADVQQSDPYLRVRDLARDAYSAVQESK